MFANNSKREVRPRLFLYGEKFPEKLYSVVQDGFLLSWDEAGERINIGDPVESQYSGRWKSEGPQRFEDQVMDLYPGFVQIPQFANLRRLFREYSFNWHLSSSGHFTFSHPCFVRGRTDLLSKIRTRRKSLPLYGFRRTTRRRSLRRSSPELKKKDTDISKEAGCNYDIMSDNSFHSCKKLLLENDAFLANDDESKRQSCQMNKDQLQSIFKSFLKNELEQHDKNLLKFNWNYSLSSISNGSFEDKTDSFNYNNFSTICPDEEEEESSNENLEEEDHCLIENNVDDDTDLLEWTHGPHGYLRPVLNSEGLITRKYYPL